MPQRTVYHVLPGEDVWQVKAEGGARASSNHERKQEAIRRAREPAQNTPSGQVVVHRSDGTVQYASAYDDTN